MASNKKPVPSKAEKVALSALESAAQDTVEYHLLNAMVAHERWRHLECSEHLQRALIALKK